MTQRFQHINDSVLLQWYQDKKDPDYLGALLYRYTQLLLGVAMKYLEDINRAEDIVQQVFEKAIKAFESQKIENVGGWLYLVTKNEALSYLRNKKHQYSELTEVTFEEDKVTLRDHWQQVEDIELVTKSIGELKEEQKICIELFFIKNKTYSEIETLTGYDFKQIKSFIQNGKRNLKIKMTTNQINTLNREEE